MPDISEREKDFFIIYLRPVILLLAGLWFILSTIPKSLEWNSLKTNGTPTEAVIVSIRKSSSQHGRSSTTIHKVYVKYTADGQEYEGTLNTYSPEMREGGKVTVYVSRNNPYNFMATPTGYIKSYTMGALLIAAGTVMLLLASKRREYT